MIYRVFSDHPKFKNVQFHEGLNILLADKSPGATKRHTRNRAGKSSFVELVNFLLGADCERDSIFRNEALVDSMFGMEFDLAGRPIRVERTGKDASKVFIEGNIDDWPIKPQVHRATGRRVLSNTKWRLVLGTLMFGLPEDQEHVTKYAPSFRSLFSYFARRQGAGGFNSYVKHAVQQQPGDFQVPLSYLLGLDWTLAQRWELVRERERTLRELKKAAGEGAFGNVVGTSADLRTRLAVAEEQVRRQRAAVESFHVLPQYHELENEASQLTLELATLADENTQDKELLSHLQKSLETEAAPKHDDLERLYSEAGVILPDIVNRRLAEVRRFHETVVENRQSYLHAEMRDAQRRLDARHEVMSSLSARRAQVMSILKAHGALEHFSQLQSELARMDAQAEALRQQFVAAQQLEGATTELDLERTQLQQRLQQDFDEQDDVLTEAILAFEEISSALYESAGSLTIDPSLNGPQFAIKIQGHRSKGIGNMQIFCFDMMLMQLSIKRNLGPGFLIHDSHLFDGVDERQVATALQVGAQTAERLGFQYIVTMNSDSLPKHSERSSPLDGCILPIKLTDATEDGGLFGVRF